MFKKLGELIEISPYSIQAASSIPPIDPEVLDEMKKVAVSLKRIAPKAEDFLYFSAVMMHAAEAALINDDGTPRLTRTGEPLKATWDISANGSWKWVCNDATVKCLKNANGDIFPESELIKAYKKWVGKPLCIDHKSASVDHVRGFIVDTYYDRNLKRVVALCALDRKNYPDLARKIETGYSNAVSMGTGVERAICYDCGTVARTEADFCHHMRTKTGYGEINTGLNPIELSIVVNGADADAKIKHIIAAVDTMNAYVEAKERDLSKHGKLDSLDLSMLKASIAKAIDDFAKIEREASEEKSAEDGNNAAYNQSGSSIAMPETELSGTDFSLSPPTARLAMTDELKNQLMNKLSAVEGRLAKLQDDFDKIATPTKTNEDIMSGTKDLNKQGYFLGGGGANEPTPGKVKYDIDPLNEEDRNEHDRQMVGQKPFPDVGPVDGMYPGYDSFPTGELERKKMLLRADDQVAERELRRNAVVKAAKDALAYFQNGEAASNPNTPAPKKVKYPIDKLNEEDRNYNDKQMVGQKPFPDVGSVDGLHPSPLSADQKDELKRKELLQRAGLTARFQKSADLSQATWQVFGENQKLLLSKTVDELTHGKAHELYAGVATKEFAQDLMSKIRSLGVEKVDALYSKAQVPPPAPQGDAPAVPELPVGDSVDSGKDGDPKKSTVELAEQISDLASDLLEAERASHGEPAEMGDLGKLPQAADDSSGSVSTASIQTELTTALQTALVETAETLKTHENELRAVARLYERDAVKGNKFLTEQISETVAEAKQAFADGLELMTAYIKFAETVNSLEKRATLGDNTMQPENKEIMGMLGETEAGLHELASVLDEGMEKEAAASDESSKDSSKADDIATMLADDFAADDEDSASADDEDSSSADDEEDSSCALDSHCAVVVPDAATAAEVSKANPAVMVEVKKASKIDRIAMRTKLAEEMGKINPIFYDFHPKGGHTPTAGEGVALKTQDELAKVEDIEEKHEKIMDVVRTVPSAKTKKTAEEINDLIKSGQLKVEDLDLLVANGVDSEAVKYWHELYDEVGPDGKSFAAELVKAHASAQLEEEMGKYRVKIARAFELAYDMREAGLLPDTGDRQTLGKKVDEIMTWNDQGFESMKKVVAQGAPMLRKASSVAVPQVNGQSLFSEEPAPASDLRAELDRAFSTSRPRAF